MNAAPSLRLALARMLVACCLIASATASEQAVMLPMRDLLPRLQGAEEWCLLPLAEYRVLLATARLPHEVSMPAGAAAAFLERATMTGRIGIDRPGGASRVLAIDGELIAVSVDDRPTRCRVFAELPFQLGAATIDGQPALWADDGLDLILPGRGRWRVQVAWSALMPERDGGFAGTLALPLAAGLDLRVRGDEPGELVGEGIATDGAGAWRLARARHAALPVAWRPGDAGGASTALFGVRQEVEVVGDGERRFVWTATFEPRLGEVPAQVVVTLPRGWRPAAPLGGVSRIDEQVVAGVHTLTIARAADGDVLRIDGWLDPDAAIDLPAIVGAAYQGGTIAIFGDDPALRWSTPPSWRAIASDDSAVLRRFLVPAPGEALAIASAASPGVDQVSSAARLSVGETRWRIDQRIDLRLARDRHALALRLPAGWRAVGIDVGGPRDDRAIDLDTIADGVVRVDLRRGARAGESVIVLLVLERDPVDHWSGMALATVDGVTHGDARLDLVCAPALSLAIAADGWRAGDATSIADARAALLAVGTPPSITLDVQRRTWDGAVEAYSYVLAREEDPRLRLDLRLTAREVELHELTLSAPFASGAEVRAQDGSTVTREGERWRVRFAAPWRGVRLLRLEGAFAPAAAQRISVDAPLTQVLVVQAPDEVEATYVPPADGETGALDALPAWSSPFPGAPLVEAVRLREASGPLGAITVAPRSLAVGVGGFVDRLDLAVQVAGDGTATLARCRIVAPGLVGLPLRLPPGARLVRATVDGADVALRRDGDGWIVPLPGRGHAQLALLWTGPAPGGRLALTPPRFGAMSATSVAWTVAVDAGLVAHGDDAIAAVSFPGGRREAWGPWLPAHESRIAPAALHTPPATVADPRALRPVVVEPPPRGEPVLELRGQMWLATHRGDAVAPELRLERLAALARWDAIGHALGLIAAVIAAWLLAPRAQIALVVAALCAVIATMAWERTLGPVAGMAEMLAPVLALALALRVIWRWRSARAVAVALLAIAIQAGEAPTPVLMGYEQLGPDGVPRDVVVALTRTRLDELRLASDPTADVGTGVALGAARVSARLAGEVIEGELVMAVAVAGKEWRELRLPLSGMVSEVRLDPISGTATQVGWRSGGDGSLLVALGGGSQGLLTVRWSAPAQPLAEGGRAEIAVPAGHGGTLAVTLPAGWEADCEGLPAMVHDGDAWRIDLPPNAPRVVVRWRRPVTVGDVARTVGARHALRVELAAGRLEWRDTIVFTVRGAALAQARVRLPDELAVVAVDGARLASWRQTGPDLDLTWSVPQETGATVTIAGIIPVATTRRSAPVLARVVDADDAGGRLALKHGAAQRFQLPAGIERADPAAGDDLAGRWPGPDDALSLAWSAPSRELTGVVRVELMVGRDRVRGQVVVTLAGRGEADVLALSLPSPWRVESGVRAALVGDGDARVLELRDAQPWRDGAVARFAIVAERGEVVAADEILLPTLDARGEIAPGAQDWLLGDAGDRRVRALAGEPRPLAELAPPPAAAGQSWRQALRRPAGAPALRLALEAETAAARVDSDHYLVLSGTRVRWHARLTHRPELGELRELGCTLPPRAQVVRVAAPGLGGWRRDGDRLIATLAAPTRGAVALELELDLPFDASGAELPALTSTARPGTTRVALVDGEGAGYVRIDVDGLEPLPTAQLAGALPEGVDATLVRRAWRADRPDWRLTLRVQEAVQEEGPDGVATLADVHVAFAADGSRRGRAIWHLLNRTRRQAPLILPAGAELWELRVDGVVVRPRRDPARPDAVMVPLRVQRPGEPSVRVAVVWREAADPRLADGGEAAMAAPVIDGVRVLHTLATASVPAGWNLERADGTMKRIATADADAQRARRIGEELARLRGAAGEGEGVAGSHARLVEQLDALDVELADHLVALERDGASSALDEARASRAALRAERERIDAARAATAQRRAALGIDAPLLWSGVPALGDDAGFAAPVAGPALWSTAPVISAGALGPGQVPVGLRSDGEAALGIELFAPAGGEATTFAQAGHDWRLVLRLSPPARTWWPLLPALAAVGALVVAFVRRR